MSNPPRSDGAIASQSETTYVKVTFKVLVTEAGTAEQFEFVSVEPSVGVAAEAGFKKSVSKVLATWSFAPSKENGKAVSAWVVVPVMVDLAEPIPIVGGS